MTSVNRYRCYFGGSASKEGGADGKFSSGKTADGSRLFTDPPRFEVYGQIGHLPSMYHAWLCGNLHRGIDGWKIAIEYADKMREVEYPVEVLWPTGWAGERPNPFHSYDEYEDVFLKPILKDVAELRELLKKHRIGELTEAEADKKAGDVLAVSADVKRGGDRGSNQHGAWEAKCKLHNDSTQSTRADSNNVSRRTQIKLDRLAKDRPDLLAMVRFNQMSVHKAAIEARFIKPVNPVESAKRTVGKLTEEQWIEFKQWVINK